MYEEGYQAAFHVFQVEESFSHLNGIFNVFLPLLHVIKKKEAQDKHSLPGFLPQLLIPFIRSLKQNAEEITEPSASLGGEDKRERA